MPRRRDLNELAEQAPGVYATLIAEITAFLTEPVILSHQRDSVVDHMNRLLPDHRRFIAALEQFFIARGRAELVPLPRWDARNPIPPGFEAVVRVRDSALPLTWNASEGLLAPRVANHAPINPLYNALPKPELPDELKAPRLYQFTTRQAVEHMIGHVIGNNYHSECHAKLGGPMLNEFTTAGALIFWPLHAFLDDLYYDWQRSRANRFWAGDFRGDNKDEILFYSRSDHKWWVSDFGAPNRPWQSMADTAGFGDVADGRPFWIGNFTGGGRKEVLFYSPSDQNFWLGDLSRPDLSWRVHNTSRFGNLADGRPFWVGDFSGDGRSEILFYNPGDHRWWVGDLRSPAPTWTEASNTEGFGQLAQRTMHPHGDQALWLERFPDLSLPWAWANGCFGSGQAIEGRPFWTGAFQGGGKEEILFYNPSDHRWHLGDFSQRPAVWTEVDETSGFGRLDDGRPFWTGNFGGQGRTGVLFYSPSDHKWYLGEVNESELSWRYMDETSGFGRLDDGRPFWTGNFTGDDRTEIVFYNPSDSNWFLGQFSEAGLRWHFVNNTTGFGRLDDGRPFWAGDFSGGRRTEILFYSPTDHNWWLADFREPNRPWELVNNTAGFGTIWRSGE